MVSLTCTALLDIQKMAFEKEHRELLEAAEFEQRVAAKLAAEHEKIMLNAGVCEACFAWETCFNGFEENDNAFCAFEMLKAARLQVEKEMDAEQNARLIAQKNARVRY